MSLFYRLHRDTDRSENAARFREVSGSFGATQMGAQRSYCKYKKSLNHPSHLLKPIQIQVIIFYDSVYNWISSLSLEGEA